ncbi:reverse transcriptase domain-containing protein [Tanacetum coccineum]
MRTRSQARISVPEPPVRQPSVESSNLEKPDNPPIVPMATIIVLAMAGCPHHGFSELHQLDTFYNALNANDQDSLNSAAGVSSDVAELKDMVRALILDKKNQTPAPASVKAVEQSCVTCGGGHSYQNCPATNDYRDNIQEYVSHSRRTPPYQAPAHPTPGVSKSDFDHYVKANDAVMQNMQNQMANITDLLTKIVNSNTASTSGSGSLPSNTIANPKGDLKAITTRSGVSYDGPQTSSPQETENEPEVTKDTVQPSTENIQPPVVQTHEPMCFQRLNQLALSLQGPQLEKFREKGNLLASKFMVKLLNDKDKIIDLTKTPVNENCSAVILKKFPEKLGDPGRFLIPCDFPEMNECLALADLGASINLMPLSIWKELNLPDLTKTRMILELADRTISTPTGIAEDVFVKVGTFFFPADFVVVDYVADPRVPLILGRPFLRTARALIDVHGEQMTLRHDDQSVTFKVGDTKTFSYNIIESVNRVDVIDIACEEYVQEVLEISESGNPTSPSDLIIDSRSPPFTPFGGSDFLMEEIDAFLEHDDSIPPGVDGIYDSEGDTVYLEELLSVINSDPNLPPSPVCEINVPEKIKSSCEDPPDLELKDLPSHLEYAFLEGDDKLPVIIAKNLKDEDKTALIKIPLDQEKTTFTCPYGTFAYRRMPFGLCNAPGMFQRCMVAIFHDMIEKTMEVFMDDFSVFGDSFSSCLSHLDKMLQRCEDTNLVLNWEKCHFMVKEGIVLGHKISKSGD